MIGDYASDLGKACRLLDMEWTRVSQSPLGKLLGWQSAQAQSSCQSGKPIALSIDLPSETVAAHYQALVRGDVRTLLE